MVGRLHAQADDGSGGDEDEDGSISAGKYKGANSVFRTKSGDSKQRQWYIFDHALALPEYAMP